MPDRAEPIVVNRYLTARGEEKSVTLYWYQSRNRIIAGEFSAKFWLIADSIRYHRSDSSLVKGGGTGTQQRRGSSHADRH